MTKENAITRKNLIQSLIIGLIIGTFLGAPLGWLAHRFYATQRLAQSLLCRENHRNQPEAIVDSICGSRY